MVFPRCFPGVSQATLLATLPHLATIAYRRRRCHMLSHGMAGAGCQVYTTAQAPNLLEP